MHCSVLQKGKLIDLLEMQCCGHEGCNGRLQVTGVQHHFTVGIYHIICSNSIKEPKTRTINGKRGCPNPKYHYLRWTTQYPSGNGDYTCNERLVGATFMSGSNLTKLNRQMQILKMPQFDPDFYRRYTAVVARAVEILGREEVTKQFEKFCDLPFEQSRIAIDACHDSARGAMNTVMEALCEAMQDKIIWLEIMNTPTTTKCAWNNDKVMTFKMFQDFIKKKKALRGCAHDDCKATSKEIDGYNNEMDEIMPHREGKCEDTNDPWHGQRCNVKWLEKLIEMYTKSCKRTVKDREGKVMKTREDSISIKNKEIGRRQIMRVKGRVEQAMLQVCHAAHGKQNEGAERDTTLAVDTIKDMLYGCLLEDDHTLCEKILGHDCVCAETKRIRQRMKKHLDPEMMNSVDLQSGKMFTLKGKNLDFSNNPYQIREELERRMLKAGHPIHTVMKRKRDALVGDESDEDSDSDEEYDCEKDPDVKLVKNVSGTFDPYQPIESVLTHPLAIRVLIDYLDSGKLERSVKMHEDCQSTHNVESFHAQLLTYRPKRSHFPKTHDARIYLGAMDWNENITREHKKVERKKSSTYANRRRKCATKKTFNFMDKVADYALSFGVWSSKTAPRSCGAGSIVNTINQS